MVQRLLIGRLMLSAILALSIIPQAAAAPTNSKTTKNAAGAEVWPDLLLEGGRKLTYERTIYSERDVRGKPGFWTKLANVVVGEPDLKLMMRPYGVAVDSKSRIIVTDPGAAQVHIFDPAQKKYKLLQRRDTDKDEMVEPQCVAVDKHDNIYITDSKAGRIFVFDSNGKYRRAIGSLKGGEGFFKRPTGIAIDPETQNLYITDTLRDKVFVVAPTGEVLRNFGKTGTAHGEFRYPTQVLVHNNTVAVVDAMNFRVELYSPDGTFKGSVGAADEPMETIYRPKGIAFDSEGHLYVVEAQSGQVDVFDLQGNLLYYFGRGTGFGEFQLPSGVFIDNGDRVYVVDSFHHRIEIFRYFGLRTTTTGVVQ